MLIFSNTKLSVSFRTEGLLNIYIKGGVVLTQILAVWSMALVRTKLPSGLSDIPAQNFNLYPQSYHCLVYSLFTWQLPCISFQTSFLPCLHPRSVHVTGYNFNKRKEKDRRDELKGRKRNYSVSKNCTCDGVRVALDGGLQLRLPQVPDLDVVVQSARHHLKRILRVYCISLIVSIFIISL